MLKFSAIIKKKISAETNANFWSYVVGGSIDDAGKVYIAFIEYGIL